MAANINQANWLLGGVYERPRIPSSKDERRKRRLEQFSPRHRQIHS